MGDGMSILTNVSKIGSVARTVAEQHGHAQAQESAAKKAQQPPEPESVLLKNVDRAEREKIRESEEERRKRRRQAKHQAPGKRRADSRGGSIDLKV